MRVLLWKYLIMIAHITAFNLAAVPASRNAPTPLMSHSSRVTLYDHCHSNHPHCFCMNLLVFTFFSENQCSYMQYISGAEILEWFYRTFLTSVWSSHLRRLLLLLPILIWSNIYYKLFLLWKYLSDAQKLVGKNNITHSTAMHHCLVVASTSFQKLLSSSKQHPIVGFPLTRSKLFSLHKF